MFQVADRGCYLDGGCQVCLRWRIGDAILMEAVKYVQAFLKK
jgi:hypothetical protein